MTTTTYACAPASHQEDIRMTRQEGLAMGECQIATDDEGRPVVIWNGTRIAKRGDPNTPDAGKWVSTEPGFTVRDGKKRKGGERELIVERDGVAMQFESFPRGYPN